MTNDKVPEIDQVVRLMAEDYLANGGAGRAAKAILAILKNGSVTTEDLSAMGYEHPPRAIGDVRDHGLPVDTKMEVNAQGRRMARYFFGTAQDIRKGQTGRTNFSKKFRQAIIAAYGTKDAISGAVHQPRSLQIDHRIPYRIAGDAGLTTNDVSAYMLLDGKSQRQKSFSCENCENFKTILNPLICRSCFWAFPENYTHVAMHDIRRVDLVWQGEEVVEYEAIADQATSENRTVADLLKELGRREIKSS